MFARDITQGITKGQVLRYMFMPQILPRLRSFASEGFSNLAFMIALVYRSVNLLPATHAIFRPENRRSLTLHMVIGTAASNLKFSRQNIDQIIIFFSILIGMVLLAGQFAMLLAYVMINPALAATMPTKYSEFFLEHQPEDIAYILLFTVFGVPEIFKTGAERTDFHTALHNMFQLYSVGLLVVAVIIVCYFIFAVVVETAQTGVPFGKRYNHVWTPIRLVFALGLLVPVGYGLNSAQWITLYSAKFGSDFATKGWVLFNESMSEAYLSKPEERVGTPKVPNIKPLAAFMTTVLTCKALYEHWDPRGGPADIQAYVISESGATSTTAPPTLAAYMTEVASAGTTSAPAEGEETEPRRDVYIRFGILDETNFADERGHVGPHCGDIVVYSGEAVEEGAVQIQKDYLQLLSDIWMGSYGLQEAAEIWKDKFLNDGYEGPDPNYKAKAVDDINKYIEEKITAAVKLQASSKSWERDMADIRKLGWGGAGIWYNKIAQINGSLVTAVNNVPQAKLMPAVMEEIKNENLQKNRNAAEIFSPGLSGAKRMEFTSTEKEQIGGPLDTVFKDWSRDLSKGKDANQTRATGNMFIDVINVIFGTQGLFAMCQNTDVHPLAQLSQLGKGLVEASIRNLALGVGLSFTSTIPVAFLGPLAGSASQILMSVATITIVMGFLLYYVLPFMPFLYFFFAVGGWIKGLFEAMVGVPLWALSFLRIDGEGLPGDAGMNGFYLIFEIFLRPLLIIFGLLASVVIFAAMVKVLNEIFYLVVANVSGHDPNSTAKCGAGGSSNSDDAMSYFRGPIDELFFTVIYAIIVYMIGMSCFKLIDLVPNNILRYMGVSVNTFNDKAADPADGLMFRLSTGGSIVSGKLLGGDGVLGSLTQALQKAGKGAADAVSPPPPPGTTN